MNRLTHGMAALVLFTALGLLVPGTFAGSALADPNWENDHNTIEDPRWFYCQIGGNTVPFHVVSPANSKGEFHDLGSTTILSYAYDVRDRHYVSYDPNDPGAAPVEDFTVENIFYGQNGKGNKNGKFAKAVPCHEYFQFDTIGDGDPVEESVGMHYHVDQDRTWYVTMTGNGRSVVKSGGRHRHHRH